MIAWMLYMVLVSALVAGAATAIDRVARFAGRPTRWIWALAMLASIALAVVAPLRTSASHAPTVFVAPVSSTTYSVSAADSLPARVWLADARRLLDVPFVSGAASLTRLPASVNRFALVTWLLATVVLGLLLVLVHAGFVRTARRWPVAEIQGRRVRLSPSTGPVVVGLACPEIIVPRWFLDRAPAEQRVVLDHEAEHIEAGDALMLAGACGAVAVMPWNVALWYMLSRVRLAVELDCDARVLRRGVPASTYGTLLIDLAEQALPLRLTVAALADDPSHLRQRIIAMKREIPRFALLRAGAAATIALVGLLAACEAKLPTESDIKQMDVASAERAARKLSLVGASDSMIYTIDGLTVSEHTAKGVSPESIKAIAFEKIDAGTSILAIETKEPNPDKYGGPARRYDSSEVYAKGFVDSTRGPNGRTLIAGAKQGGVAPILIVDGVRTDSATFAKIRRDDIKDVEIIKGNGAVALYGPDADHGAIVVRTKRK
jgi:beta-lactamase regulating signal transducer with metallopeptidase domain